jgi:RNA polymerase sigma factor (sigma-70 family)
VLVADFARLSDEELVAACRAGDEAAWDALVGRYQRLVYTVPARFGLTPGEVEDVFQTVWLLLLKNLATLRQPDRLAAWLVTTARRECWERRRGADYQRVTFVAPGSLAAESWVDEQNSEDVAADYEEYRTLHDALAQLDEPCRRLLASLYSDTNDHSYADIAARLSIPIGSIGPTRARCLKKLKQIMEESGKWGR